MNAWKEHNLRANSDLKASKYSTPVLGLIFLKLPEKEGIAKAIRKAMEAIEEYKLELAGVLPGAEYARLTRTDKTTSKQLLKSFADIPQDADGDIFGQIYEYFLAFRRPGRRRVLHPALGGAADGRDQRLFSIQNIPYITTIR